LTHPETEHHHEQRFRVGCGGWLMIAILVIFAIVSIYSVFLLPTEYNIHWCQNYLEDHPGEGTYVKYFTDPPVEPTPVGTLEVSYMDRNNARFTVAEEQNSDHMVTITCARTTPTPQTIIR
jgi:hypothetical protein